MDGAWLECAFSSAREEEMTPIFLRLVLIQVLSLFGLGFSMSFAYFYWRLTESLAEVVHYAMPIYVLPLILTLPATYFLERYFLNPCSALRISVFGFLQGAILPLLGSWAGSVISGFPSSAPVDSIFFGIAVALALPVLSALLALLPMSIYRKIRP